MKRGLPLLLLTLVATMSCSRTASSLRVASDLANPPFAFLDDEGIPEGRDVRMMRRIAKKVGREVRWVRMPFEELLDAAAAGEVDAVCATLGITEERLVRVDFSEPYYETRIAVIVRDAGGPRNLAELAAKAGARVGASAGTTSERAVKHALPNATCVPSADAAAIAGVRDGTLAAAVMDGPAADRRARDAEDLRVLKTPLADERYALALPKGSDWRLPFDGVIVGMRNDGELEALDREFGLR